MTVNIQLIRILESYLFFLYLIVVVKMKLNKAKILLE